MSATLTISITFDQNDEIIKFKNVAFGDVLFCAGQSNMLLTIGNTKMNTDVVSRYTKARPGLLRGYTVIQQLANEPKDAMSRHGKWFE